MDPIDALKSFGFTRQEATVYLTLLTHGEQSGYEAAKNAGISRSNAYAALAGLAEKGAAMQGGGETRTYSATPAAELVGNLRRQCMKTLDALESALPARRETEAPYLAVTGSDNVRDKIVNVLDAATRRVYVSLHGDDLAGQIAEALRRAADRGLKTVILCDADPGIPGAAFHHTQRMPGQFNIIADTEAVLTGSLRPDATAQCLYSRNSNLVRLMREAFVNELELVRQREETSR
ncbi:sugar-specific transcriptional regulator TrmB [Desulfobaculum xiamenense]|uniref:Sugar-specific transcriptional regulator TrmB n=1 Tax=Desulfobaculum xiamenense TaxID=995050 RepID=A0A846QSD1_9BACT|nr:TrmB family transcriptional regulator [Desulfobaculum xiamenense]NJB67569.1 sugar-specific transcriptional regulator TrmB [Desulfobaculum xiamenense]